MNNNIIVNDVDKAEAFNDFFGSILQVFDAHAAIHGVERGSTSDGFLGGGKKRAVWEFEGKYIIANQF